jgi:hypothetical protein
LRARGAQKHCGHRQDGNRHVSHSWSPIRIIPGGVAAAARGHVPLATFAAANEGSRLAVGGRSRRCR